MKVNPLEAADGMAVVVTVDRRGESAQRWVDVILGRVDMVIPHERSVRIG
jgi:hypothetical protein